MTEKVKRFFFVKVILAVSGQGIGYQVMKEATILFGISNFIRILYV